MIETDIQIQRQTDIQTYREEEEERESYRQTAGQTET